MRKYRVGTWFQPDLCLQRGGRPNDTSRGFGHRMGPSIDFRSARRGDTARQSKRLRDGSYMSIEVNSLTAVPEWDGQEVGARATDFGPTS